MSTATATYRVNYTEYMADVTGSPKTTRKSANIGFIPIDNPNLNRQNRGIQQTGAMPTYGGSSEKCARCSKTVYLAEKKVGAGRSFHVRCFSCRTCNRKLDATILSEHKGEIYCKTCYTRQFGVHGLANGVTMTTETPARENRPSRRSSYGSDLDAPIITHKQIRQRAHSNDNALRGEHSAIQNDELPKMFPWRNDVIPEQHSSSINTEHDRIADKNYQRPISQIGFQRVIESTNSDNNYRYSTNSREDDQNQYVFDDEKTYYANRTSAITDIPVISPPKRLDSTIEKIAMPITPTKNDEQFRSPSPISTDIYRRQSSREHPIDISDNFSRLTISENQQEINNEKYSNDNKTTNVITSENPLLKPTYSHSSSYENKPIISNTNNFYREQSYSNDNKTTNMMTSEFPLVKPTYSHSSSYENKQTTLNTNNFYREQSHSRDSSPSANINSNRSPSPTSGYASSSVHGEGILRDSTSPSSVNMPQYDYLNARPSNTNVVDRRSTSSRQNERTSALNEFISKTTMPLPTAGEKYSAISALVQPMRPFSQIHHSNNDDLDD
ncbi:unnamed protein product [Rotaria sordida]|uniref:LIM zinc-binding domain-containing protein n=1 Tax=Rotaria sordida TaxID=392033 RepID=A0A819DSQ5_9BILA|nr:unnamed protein product [Rotaria sordida]